MNMQRARTPSAPSSGRFIGHQQRPASSLEQDRYATTPERSERASPPSTTAIAQVIVPSAQFPSKLSNPNVGLPSVGARGFGSRQAAERMRARAVSPDHRPVATPASRARVSAAASRSPQIGVPQRVDPPAHVRAPQRRAPPTRSDQLQGMFSPAAHHRRKLQNSQRFLRGGGRAGGGGFGRPSSSASSLKARTENNNTEKGQLADLSMLAASCRRSQRVDQEGAAYLSIGVLFDNMNELKRAIDHYKLYLKCCQKSKDVTGAVLACNCIGINYYLLGLEGCPEGAASVVDAITQGAALEGLEGPGGGQRRQLLDRAKYVEEEGVIRGGGGGVGGVGGVGGGLPHLTCSNVLCVPMCSVFHSCSTRYGTGQPYFLSPLLFACSQSSVSSPF